MKEPLDYLSRKQLQLNILRNIEKKILTDTRVEEYDNDGNLELKHWWESNPNWYKVQTFINCNTKKAGSNSSAGQCVYLGVDPDAKSFYDMIEKKQNNKNEDEIEEFVPYKDYEKQRELFMETIRELEKKIKEQELEIEKYRKLMHLREIK